MIYAEVLTPELLAETRTAMNMTRAELADKLGVNYQTVRLWEQPGAKIPRMAEVAFTAVVWVWMEQSQKERETFSAFCEKWRLKNHVESLQNERSGSV